MCVWVRSWVCWFLGAITLLSNVTDTIRKKMRDANEWWPIGNPNNLMRHKNTQKSGKPQEWNRNPNNHRLEIINRVNHEIWAKNKTWVFEKCERHPPEMETRIKVNRTKDMYQNYTRPTWIGRMQYHTSIFISGGNTQYPMPLHMTFPGPENSVLTNHGIVTT